jgi:hypothetical protein
MDDGARDRARQGRAMEEDRARRQDAMGGRGRSQDEDVVGDAGAARMRPRGVMQAR